MINCFEKIVEKRIKEAQKLGKFETLKGAGEPLSKDENFAFVPEDLRLAYKILKNGGYLPPEIEIRKKIEQTEELLEACSDIKERYKILKKINLLIMKANLSRENKNVRFDIPQKYMEKLVEKVGD